jgi:GT2 family glycosyltransferase
MFIDSDMVFPPEGIAKLISRGKSVIGADYNYKYSPKRSVTNIDPSKLQENQMVEDPKWPGHKFLNPENRPQEPFEVRAVGTGFMLIDTSVLKKIPKPWFWFDRKDGYLLGEDVWFCDRAKEAGFSIWCDPTIPMEHIGTALY